MRLCIEYYAKLHNLTIEMGKEKVAYAAYKPEELNDEAWGAIVEAWENGLSDREASLRAARDSGMFVTEAQLKAIVNRSPEIASLREYLHCELVAQAKLNIANSMRSGSVSTAKWFLERKVPDEYSTKAAVAFEGAVVGLTMEEKQAELDKLLDGFGLTDEKGKPENDGDDGAK